jgi:putative FmdB family regulatory protein
MPTYEYECEECGHRFEQLQKMSDDPLRECPECGGPVRRLIGAGSGVIFKGKGFYATDYRNQNRSTRCGKDSPCCGRDVPCEKRPCDD